MPYTKFIFPWCILETGGKGCIARIVSNSKNSKSITTRFMQDLVYLFFLLAVVPQEMNFQITALSLELQLVRPQKQKCVAIIVRIEGEKRKPSSRQENYRDFDW
jgi:hypothetical protein